MNKLNELIQKLCPDGVEYKKLGEIATISRGGNFQKKDYVEAGVPCIHYGQIYTQYSLFTEKTLNFISEEKAKKQKVAVKNDVIMAVTSENIDDVCKCIAWLGEEDVAVSGHTAIIHHTINPKYLVYYLHSTMFYKQKTKLAHGTKVIEVTPDKLVDIILPVPPLEIQSEIVRILDNFTELTSELTSEITAELTVRKKQYEHYRNTLLTFDGTTRFEKLGDTCHMKSGKAIQAAKIAAKPTEDSPYECFGGNGIRGYVAEACHHGEFPIIGRQGALCGNINYASGDFYATEHAVVVESKGDYLQRFLYYLLISMNLNQYKSQGAQPGLAVGNLENLIAPVPSIKEQERIISILDRFDAIFYDLSKGLPAEIKARQKQYEYYRDKLLTFKELNT